VRAGVENVVSNIMAYQVAYTERICPGVTAQDGLDLASLTREETSATDALCALAG